MKRIIKIMLVMFVLVWCLVACNPDAEEIDWENIELGEVLPEPQSNLMEILINDKERINVTICEITENDYLEYRMRKDLL